MISGRSPPGEIRKKHLGNCMLSREAAELCHRYSEDFSYLKLRLSMFEDTNGIRDPRSRHSFRESDSRLLERFDEIEKRPLTPKKFKYQSHS